MSKKVMLVVSLMLIAVFVLAACQPSATEAPTQGAQPQPTEAVQEQPTEAAPVESPTEAPTEAAAAGGDAVTITIWHQWDGKYLDAITQAFKDYEADHPGVKIDLSKPEDVANALNVAIPAGEGPDIIGWANDKIGEQALKGNIISLSDLGIDTAFLESTYAPSAVAGVQWQDQIWGLPETIEGIALVYNKDLVTEDYLPSDPADFADLLAKAEKFQTDKQLPLICNQGFGANDAYHMSPIYFGFGVPTFISEDGTVNLDTPEAIQAATWLADLSKVSLQENTYDICNAALKEGQIGMWWTGPWAIAGVEENQVNYGILPMGKPFVGIKTMMISQNAVDRGTAETSLDIIKYYTSADVQKQLALVNKTIPAATAALEDPEVAALPAVVGFGEALKIGVPMSPSPFSSAQWDPVGKASQAVWTGAQTPEQAMADAQTAAEEAVSAMK